MLIYDQPIDQAKPERRPAAAPAPAGFSVLDLAQLLWQRKVAIASAALICACVAVAIGKSLTPKYTATAQLYVDPRELQLVDRELTPRAQDISGLAMVVESQARLITSNNVLLQVIRDTNLEKDPEFGGGDSKGLLGSLLGLFGIELRPTAEQQKLDPDGRAGSAQSATSTSRRPTAPSSSISTSGRMSRPRRRCSPTRSRRPISPNPSSRRPPPRGAPPPTFPAG